MSIPDERASLRTTVPWAAVAELAQLVFGVLTFALLAGWMQPTEYGLYAAILAYSTVGMTLSFFGSQQILMLDTAAGRPFASVWKRTLSVITTGSVVITLLAGVLQPLLLPEATRGSFLLFFVAMTGLLGIIEFSVIAAQAHRDLKAAAIIRIVSGVARLGSVIGFGLWTQRAVQDWAWFAVGGWSIGAVFALTVVARRFGAAPRWGRPSGAEVVRGRSYVFADGATKFLDAADRPLLVRFGFQSDAGYYSAGFRVAGLALLPLFALVRATDADFFEDGTTGAHATLVRARRLGKVAVLYGAGAFVGLALGAPLVPAVLGADYAEATDVVRFLALLPLLRGLQLFFGNALTGAGNQRLRNWALIVSAITNVSLNLAIIPRYGWRGAALSTLVGETMLAAVLILCAERTGRRASRAPDFEDARGT